MTGDRYLPPPGAGYRPVRGREGTSQYGGMPLDRPVPPRGSAGVSPRPIPLGAAMAGHLDATPVDAPVPAWAQQVLDTLRDAGRAMQAGLQRVNEVMGDALREAVTEANTPERLAALGGKYYVRAALDPAYTTPAGLARLETHLRTSHGDDLGLLTTTSREALVSTVRVAWALHRANHDTVEWLGTDR